ncbi:MAG TPA: TCR/Tet family MFS transporter [Paracoccus sp. (in: a-proteobacteria)]|nr:TCR/Tet family MFS transporter [Paracoccus sp. (in: a-proteobacteria)]
MTDRSSLALVSARGLPRHPRGAAARLFILLTVLIDATGMGLIFPVMPDLIEELTGQGLAGAAIWGGILGTSYSAMQFLFGPIVGNLSDAHGRRPVMLTALFVMTLDYVLLALAPTITLIVIGRVVGGILAATHATAAAYMADISRPEEKGRNFGLIGAAFGVGFVLGPVLGSLMSTIDLRAPFWTAAVLAGANMVFGWFVLPETVTDAIRRPFSWRRANPLSAFAAVGRLPGIGPLLLAFGLFNLAGYVYPAVWSFFGKARFGWDPVHIGLSLTAFGITIALVQGVLVGPTIRRLGAWHTACLGFALEAVALIFYGFVTSPMLAIAFTPFAAIAGLGGPALQQMMSNLAAADQQGELQGVLGSVAAIAMGISPLIMTTIFAFFTREGAPVHAPGMPFLASAAMMLAAFVILMRARPPGHI